MLKPTFDGNRKPEIGSASICLSPEVTLDAQTPSNVKQQSWAKMMYIKKMMALSIMDC